MATWTKAAKVRGDFADMLEGLTPEQLEHGTLCAEWNANQVGAHLVSFVETSALGFIGHMAKARFNFDKMSMAMAKEQTDSKSTADLIAVLRAKGSKSAPMPGFPEGLTVADAAIHTQDVRRPLGLSGSLDPEILRMSLDFVTSNKKNKVLISDLPSLDNVTLRATDIDWSFGSGPVIEGPGEAILMAIARRKEALADLSGEGLSAWK